MKIQICDDCAYIDGKLHKLVANNRGADRIRQTIVIEPLEAAKPAKAKPDDLDDLSVAGLRALATERGIPHSKLNRAALLTALRG